MHQSCVEILPTAPTMPSSRVKRVALWISNIFSPPVFSATILLLAATRGPIRSPILLTIGIIGLAVIFPMGFILFLLQTGKVSDYDITVRKERNLPYLFILASSAIAGFLAIQYSMNLTLSILLMASWVLALLQFIINTRWKISGHAAAVTAFAIVLWQLAGGLAILTLLLIPLVIASRLILRRHTLLQTLAGAALSAILFLVACTLIPGNYPSGY